MSDKYELANEFVGYSEQNIDFLLKNRGYNENEIADVKLIIGTWLNPFVSKHFKTICINAIKTKLIEMRDIDTFAQREWKLDKSLSKRFKKYEYFLNTINVVVMQNI